MTRASSSGLGHRAPWAPDALRVPEMMGRYAPLARLGQGGMADVFLTLAHGPQGVNKLAVVKRLRNQNDAAMTEMFLDEARLAARLNHPNIVHTYEVGEVQGEYFIAMEYLEGQPLSRMLKTIESRGGLDERFVAFIAIEVLKGLHYAHEFCDFDGTPLGVVHRDVSPQNLFVTYGGEIKLLDFGIAKAALNVAHTEDGALKGKVRYMAPEHALGRSTDRRADVFAFGIVLWEMIARRPLFTGSTALILTRIVNEDIPPVSDVRPDVSPVLDAIVRKATRRNRDERYGTAEEMRLDLEAYLRGRTDLVSERDLARLMNEAFASIRDDVRFRIREYVASMPATPPNAPGLAGTGKLPILPSWSGPPAEPSRSSTSAPRPVSAPVAVEERGSTASQPAPRARGSRGTLWLFTFLLGAAAGAAVLAPRSPLHWSGWLPAPIASALQQAGLSSPPAPDPVRPEPPPSPAAASATTTASTALVARPAAVSSSTQGPGAAAEKTPAPVPPAVVAPVGHAPAGPHHAHVLPAAAPASPSPSTIAPVARPAVPASEQPRIRMLDESEGDSP